MEYSVVVGKLMCARGEKSGGVGGAGSDEGSVCGGWTDLLCSWHVSRWI